MFKNLDASIQYHIRCKKGDVGRYVLLPGDPERCKKIAEYFDDYQFIAQNREFTTYTGHIDGEKVSVVSTGIGGPSTAIAVEELVKIGADTLIRVGTAGGMNIKVAPGDLAIATSSIRMDGTSLEYMPLEFPASADFNVTSALVNAAEKLSASFHTGIIHSKDSFYGQRDPSRMPISTDLKNKWKAWLEGGCLASEMESSTLFIVSSVLGVRAGAVLYVASNQEREKSGIEDKYTDDNRIAIETAIEAIRNLIINDKKLQNK